MVWEHLKHVICLVAGIGLLRNRLCQTNLFLIFDTSADLGNHFSRKSDHISVMSFWIHMLINQKMVKEIFSNMYNHWKVSKWHILGLYFWLCFKIFMNDMDLHVQLVENTSLNRLIQSFFTRQYSDFPESIYTHRDTHTYVNKMCLCVHSLDSESVCIAITGWCVIYNHLISYPSFFLLFFLFLFMVFYILFSFLLFLLLQFSFSLSQSICEETGAFVIQSFPPSEFWWFQPCDLACSFTAVYPVWYWLLKWVVSFAFFKDNLIVLVFNC